MMQLKAHAQVEWEHHEEELRRHIARLEREKEVRILKIFPILKFSFNKKYTKSVSKVDFYEEKIAKRVSLKFAKKN